MRIFPVSFIIGTLASGLAAAGIFRRGATTETRGPLPQSFFKSPRFRRIAQPDAAPAASLDPQLTGKTGREPDKPLSPLYGLAANNPHVIAITLFTRKAR